MSTKSGLKKTFSWRFGPSKFGRKSKPQSVVEVVLLLFVCWFEREFRRDNLCVELQLCTLTW